MIVPKPLLLLLALLALFSTSACGESDDAPAAVVTVTASPTPELHTRATLSPSEEDPVEKDLPSEAPEGAAPPEGVIGRQVKLSSDWSIKLLSVERNADQVILESNPFNDPPEGRFVLVTYEATYTGEEKEGNLTFGLRWEWVTADQTIRHDFDAEGTAPADDEGWPTHVRPGGTVKGQVLFDVPAQQIPGSILSVLDDANRNLYVDFKIA